MPVIANGSVPPQTRDQPYTLGMSRASIGRATGTILVISVALALGGYWRFLFFLDVGGGVLVLAGLIASRIWPDKIWIRGTR